MSFDSDNLSDDSIFETPGEYRSALRSEIDALSSELKAIQERVVRIQEQAASIENHASTSDAALDWFEDRVGSVWSRPTKLEAERIPKFVPIQQRHVGPNNVSTRFISFINLKGGVGKTTISANLAAAFAAGNYSSTSGRAGRPLRALVVDLDFQGTLSRRCAASSESLLRASVNRATSLRLLSAPQTKEKQTPSLTVPFINRVNVADVIPADDELDAEDFRQLAKLAANIKETRYYYRLWFHRDEVFNRYDVVIFDCPPRLTTSSICALVASDFVFIPTAPDPFDVPAVSRTLNWIGTTRKNLNLSVQIGGIVFNRTSKAAGLSKKEQTQRKQLEVALQDFNVVFPNVCPDARYCVLDAFVPRRAGASNSINGNEGTALPGEKEPFFSALATEVYQRIYE